MPFCTKCGSQLDENARFCSSCGATAGGGAATGSASVATVQAPLDFKIQGDNLQVARVQLKPGQEIYAEAGKMVFKSTTIQWESRMTGESIGEKIWGALKRKLSGESLFMTYFRTTAGGEVGFAGNYPGCVQHLDLAAGQSVLVQRDSFLFAQSSVDLSIAFVKKIGAGLLGGEGFILQKLTGPGSVFIHGGGDFIEFQLGPSETLQVDTGCIVGFDESVDYDIQFVGGIKTAIFGGEGLFIATLTGPGRVLIQSMTIEKMRRELNPVRSGGDERGALESLGGFFSSEDR